MASRIAYKDESSFQRTDDVSSIVSTEKPRADGPNINLEALSNQGPISRAEIAILNAPDRTDLIAQAMRKSELPQDVFDALGPRPAFRVDASSLEAAVSNPPRSYDIPPADLHFLDNINAQTVDGTAVQTEQDQQDCCHCCNLQ